MEWTWNCVGGCIGDSSCRVLLALNLSRLLVLDQVNGYDAFGVYRESAVKTPNTCLSRSARFTGPLHPKTVTRICTDCLSYVNPRLHLTDVG